MKVVIIKGKSKKGLKNLHKWEKYSYTFMEKRKKENLYKNIHCLKKRITLIQWF